MTGDPTTGDPTTGDPTTGDSTTASRRSRHDQVGAGTVLAVAMMGLLVTVTVGVSGAVGVVAAHRRAQSAADLAALAAATAIQGGRDPCGQARLIASRNGAALQRCKVDGWDVAVAVRTQVRLPGGSMDLEARGRAGPVGDERG